MVDHGCTHEVVSTLVTLVNSLKQEHHVLEELASVVPLTYCIDSFDDDLVDDLSRVSVNQSDPCVNNVSFHSKLNINSFEHLDTSNNIVQSLLLRLLSAYLVHQDQSLDVSLQLSC